MSSAIISEHPDNGRRGKDLPDATQAQLDRLRPGQRELYDLLKREGLSQRGCATKTGKSETAVSGMVAAIRRRLEPIDAHALPPVGQFDTFTKDGISYVWIGDGAKWINDALKDAPKDAQRKPGAGQRFVITTSTLNRYTLKKRGGCPVLDSRVLTPTPGYVFSTAAGPRDVYERGYLAEPTLQAIVDAVLGIYEAEKVSLRGRATLSLWEIPQEYPHFPASFICKWTLRKHPLFKQKLRAEEKPRMNRLGRIKLVREWGSAQLDKWSRGLGYLRDADGNWTRGGPKTNGETIKHAHDRTTIPIATLYSLARRKDIKKTAQAQKVPAGNLYELRIPTALVNDYDAERKKSLKAVNAEESGYFRDKDGTLYRSPYAVARDFPDADVTSQMLSHANRKGSVAFNWKLDRFRKTIPNGPRGVSRPTYVYGGKLADGTEKMERYIEWQRAQRRLKEKWDGQPDFRDNGRDYVTWSRCYDFGLDPRTIHSQLVTRAKPRPDGTYEHATKQSLFGSHTTDPIWLYDVEYLLAQALPEVQRQVRRLIERATRTQPKPSAPTAASLSPAKDAAVTVSAPMPASTTTAAASDGRFYIKPLACLGMLTPVMGLLDKPQLRKRLERIRKRCRWIEDENGIRGDLFQLVVSMLKARTVKRGDATGAILALPTDPTPQDIERMKQAINAEGIAKKRGSQYAEIPRADFLESAKALGFTGRFLMP